MTFQEACEAFFQLEQDLDLFEWQMEGVPIWELIRVQVFSAMTQESGFHGQAHAGADTSLKGRSLKFVRSIKSYIFNCPFFIPKHSIIFNGHPRRKLLNDGLYWDIYSDYFVDLVDNSVVLEQYYLNGHLVPAKSKRLYYADFLSIISFLIKYLFVLKQDFQCEMVCKKLKKALCLKFNMQIDIRSMIYKRVAVYKVHKMLYKILFRIVKPKACFVLVSYVNEGFISAAKDLSIPTIEIQHGVISKYHMAYSFPHKNIKTTFPDYFFSFGEFWKQSLQFPISDNKIFNIGYPHLEARRSLLSKVNKKDVLIFISQGTIGKPLSQYAVRVKRYAPEYIKIIYKLHPGEYNRWKTEYPWLLDSGIDIVDSSNPDLYELFAEAKWQVGVYSTAVFEGLAFGCQTYLLNLPGVEYMQQLIDSGCAQLVDQTTDLSFHYQPQKINKEYFFADDWKSNFRNAISKILELEQKT